MVPASGVRQGRLPKIGMHAGLPLPVQCRSMPTRPPGPVFLGSSLPATTVWSPGKDGKFENPSSLEQEAKRSREIAGPCGKVNPAPARVDPFRCVAGNLAGSMATAGAGARVSAAAFPC
jgi:hypothetical protein